MFYIVSSRRQDGDIAIRYVSDVGIDQYPLLLTWFNFNPSMDK